MRRTIDTLIPQAGQADTAALGEHDADELAAYAADPAHPWWRRRPCVLALTDRVPEHRVAALIARIQDPHDVGEVRMALLDLLADRTELLPWLSHKDRRKEDSYGVPAAILKARGLLGDRSAAGELATLAAEPWPRFRAIGEAGLDALVARYGTGTVLADVGDARPEDRTFRFRALHRAGQDITTALADPDRTVAYHAQFLLTDATRIRDYLRTGEAPTPEAGLWAAYALHRLTGDAAETRAIHDSLGRPRVEVDSLDDELRGAILQEYGHDCEENSDPRWRVEAICATPPTPTDEEDRLRRAMTALDAAGLTPEPPISCGEFNRQGGGTYHVIRSGERKIFVSALGRFATSDEDNRTTRAARTALEAAGFRWIDAATGTIRVTGLCVYYFGSRKPLNVETLLFYWQD
ncbi:hypothetical protein [Streptomyces sp. NBC_00893]|uniref:hypothetical protein n=1 Tax=Streptomyces sp. NBC_00893 TaxID=2975862 RepID=UPI00224CD256|nr:hypothetical protein [Streptomyces sp. NBC_00893]MCX4844392.1 hypothetical protein [Streptomyces sp. NBC_00893]